MKNLLKCRTYGVATKVKGIYAIGPPLSKAKRKMPIYKCADTSECQHRRDFGGMAYCSERLLSEPITKEEKKVKP